MQDFLEALTTVIWGNHSVQPYSLFFVKGLHHQSCREDFPCGSKLQI